MRKQNGAARRRLVGTERRRRRPFRSSSSAQVHYIELCLPEFSKPLRFNNNSNYLVMTYGEPQDVYAKLVTFDTMDRFTTLRLNETQIRINDA
jgi:hypothetical protein